MIATSRGVERVIRGAFEFAVANGKKRVCLVHKANAIPQFFCCGFAISGKLPRNTRTWTHRTCSWTGQPWKSFGPRSNLMSW